MQNSLQNYWGKNFISTENLPTQDIINPATEEVLAKVPLSTKNEVDQAIQTAHKAFHSWKNIPTIDRVQPLFALKQKLEQNAHEISKIIVAENGKTFKEAQGDLLRGIQMVEVATSMPTLLMGDCQNQIAKGIDSNFYRRPLGVFAGITPFNFPAMVPFWFWPFAVASGNTYILKPSERVPLTSQYIFELIDQCDFPAGVINMVHGGKEVVETLCQHQDIAGVNFVGSTPVAKLVYDMSAKTYKRVQALGGAKNYMVITEDADFNQSVKAMVDSCYGCAGERCLAGSVLVAVGDRAYNQLKERVLEEIGKVKVGNGIDPSTTLGPVISAQAKQRITADIQKAVEQGAKVLIDGRENIKQDKGYFLNPTVLEDIKMEMEFAHKEIFGPVIGLMKVDTLNEAIQRINSLEYANTTSLFTNNGSIMQKFVNEIDPSMVGINLGVPAPMAFFSFGGSKSSFFGDIKAHGPSSVEFFTQRQSIMTRWYSEGKEEIINPQWGDKNGN